MLYSNLLFSIDMLIAYVYTLSYVINVLVSKQHYYAITVNKPCIIEKPVEAM